MTDMNTDYPFMRKFFHAAYDMYFRADLTFMAQELEYASTDVLSIAMDCRDEDAITPLFERLTQYCVDRQLSMDALLHSIKR